MKKSILAILALAMISACKKNETTVIDNTTDSAMNAPAVDSTLDSATTTGINSTMTEQDKNFADAAAKGGMMEVMLGEYAEMNGANAKIKAFGKMMTEDHGKANAELKSWAASANYVLPTALDEDQQKKVDDLKMKKGADFDKAYIDMMVSDHKKDIADFKKQANDGTGDLKSFAAKTVPTLEHHLQSAEEAMTAVK